MTAGNSSPLSDGASAVVLASEGAAQSLGIEPLARVLASATHALDPQLMGIAPAFAMAKALGRAGLAPGDVDVWEVHEAFAAQALGVLRELTRQLGGFEVPDDRLNPNGGAVAIGHPFGSSGTRYVLTLATELRLPRDSLRCSRSLCRLRPGRRPGVGEPPDPVGGPSAGRRPGPRTWCMESLHRRHVWAASLRHRHDRSSGGRTARHQVGRWLWILVAGEIYAVPDPTVPVIPIQFTALGAPMFPAVRRR